MCRYHYAYLLLVLLQRPSQDYEGQTATGRKSAQNGTMITIDRSCREWETSVCFQRGSLRRYDEQTAGCHWDAIIWERVEMVNARCTSLLIKLDERTLRRLDERRHLSAQPG